MRAFGFRFSFHSALITLALFSLFSSSRATNSTEGSTYASSSSNEGNHQQQQEPNFLSPYSLNDQVAYMQQLYCVQDINAATNAFYASPHNTPGAPPWAFHNFMSNDYRQAMQGDSNDALSQLVPESLALWLNDNILTHPGLQDQSVLLPPYSEITELYYADHVPASSIPFIEHFALSFPQFFVHGIFDVAIEGSLLALEQFAADNTIPIELLPFVAVVLRYCPHFHGVYSGRIGSVLPYGFIAALRVAATARER
jgi:hypothetical protein